MNLRNVYSLNGFVAWILILPMLHGCVGLVTYSTTTTDGVQITVTHDEAGTIQSVTKNGKSTTTLQLESGPTIVVEKTRVLVDGQEKASLPEGVQKVEVRFKGGVLEVHADGRSILLNQ